ncbi:MAG: 7TM diverse intracellular signaling domain-containing protein [Burkholderiaceae bacterium]
MRAVLLRFFFLASLLGSAHAVAQPVVELPVAGPAALSRSFSWFEDRAGNLTLGQVLEPAHQAAFKPVAQSGPGANFGLTSSALWLKVTVRAPAGQPAEWLLEFAYPPIDSVELHTPLPGGGFLRQAGGDSVPLAQKAFRHRNHVFPVTLQPGAESVIYLRIQSGGTVSAPVQLWRPADLWASDQLTYAALALYFGLLIGLLAYNLLLFFSVRDRAYLIYAAFAGGMAMVQASLTGLGAQFLWPQQLWWNQVSPPVSMALAAVFGLLFARTFLDSKRLVPGLDRFVLLQSGAWVATLLAALLLPYAVSTWMVTVLAVVSVATLVTAGVMSVRRGHGGARYFLAAWAVLLLGVVTLSLHNTGAIPSNAFTANALLIGSALEMVLLSFALGNRINDVRLEKEQVARQAEAEHAMVEALSRSQEEMRQMLEERETILENSIVGIAFLTPSGRFRWANRAMIDIFGAGGNGITSMEPFYLTRDEYLRVGGEVARAIARGAVYETELQVRQYDGTLIWISLNGKAVSRTDLSQGTVWVIMNITPRKELEAQLQRTSSEREAILNSALVGIVLSVNRTHEWVNEKFAQMLGYPRQVLIGQNSSYIHPDQDAWEKFGAEARAALIATGSYICERQLKRRSGELFWVEMAGSCIRPNDPDSGVIWTFLDITDRKRSEQELRETLEQQRVLNDLRARFVAMTSHEFRTPLAAILSAEELLRHYGSKLPEEEKIEILDSIAAGVQRMSRMMDRVLLLGKADAQMLEFTPQPLDLVPLARQLVDEVRALLPEARAGVVTEFGENLARGAYDEKLLRHILGNLLSNAVKYSPAGGEVRFRLTREGAGTLFEIADQGIGIPEAEVPHLFGSFHRASNVGSIQGTGLGLAIVKTAVDKHGGRIEVESRVGEGTTFRVWLPAG